MSAPTGTKLEDRYGTRPRTTSRRTRWLLGALAVALGVAVAWIGYANLGSAPIETQASTFENLPDDAMRFTFEISRDTPERAVVCIVRVRVLDGSEGGRKEVLVPPGAESTRVTTVIHSTDEPVTADVFGCSYQVPPYLSTDLPPSE
ncbi:DUF4307 domain-containing protein [Actinophytocola gossypii]|uniref:DUF4307 domain-containing protein n=1 Tax=Actinophytocola gossypii TaxID=2812003 RepID=UPI0021A88812|nr:DUF4307 domain-containing protein [Actinophytocola gossypii]